MDSSVFIAWLKGEVVNGVDRKDVADHILGSAKRETFRICISALTLARSPTRRRWETELALADLGTIERRRERTVRRAHDGEMYATPASPPPSRAAETQIPTRVYSARYPRPHMRRRSRDPWSKVCR